MRWHKRARGATRVEGGVATARERGKVSQGVEPFVSGERGGRGGVNRMNDTRRVSWYGHCNAQSIAVKRWRLPMFLGCSRVCHRIITQAVADFSPTLSIARNAKFGDWVTLKRTVKRRFAAIWGEAVVGPDHQKLTLVPRYHAGRHSHAHGCAQSRSRACLYPWTLAAVRLSIDAYPWKSVLSAS